MIIHSSCIKISLWTINGKLIFKHNVWLHPINEILKSNAHISTQIIHQRYTSPTHRTDNGCYSYLRNGLPFLINSIPQLLHGGCWIPSGINAPFKFIQNMLNRRYLCTKYIYKRKYSIMIYKSSTESVLKILLKSDIMFSLQMM